MPQKHEFVQLEAGEDVASVRDRRRDLATLSAVGFTRLQLGSVVRWQAAALVIPAVVIIIKINI